MNDLVELKEAWGEPEPPSHAAHRAARAALMRQVAGERVPASTLRRAHRPGVRLGWLSGGTAVTAALAAAVAFAFAPATTHPSHAPGHASGTVANQSYSQLSGQQVLLAAATVAESRPVITGAYWHVKEQAYNENLGRLQTLDSWTTHDGTEYTMPEGYSGVSKAVIGDGYHVGGSSLSFGQLQQLPTDPGALKEWITDSYLHPTRWSANSGGANQPPVAASDIPVSELPGAVTVGLSGLLFEVPAPPAVRAAAFRALASMPNVTNLGTTDGGVTLRISFPPPAADKFPNGKLPAGAGEERLVVDPTTSTLLSTTNYQGTTRVLLAESTNDMPKVIS